MNTREELRSDLLGKIEADTVPYLSIRKLVVTFRCNFSGRAARQLRAAAPPSASEPRPTFTPCAFQHHHLFATRAEQRLHAVTWVFGLEPKVLVASAQ